MLFEEKLIFPAVRRPLGTWEDSGIGAEDVFFSSGDGTRLHGWYVAPRVPREYFLYAHGNGENVSYLRSLLRLLRDRFDAAVFAFDYRGYGRSAGRPNEWGVLADARAALRWFSDRVDLPAEEIVMMGRSLGGAVAIDLASQFGAKALIVENTFTSIPDVAASYFPRLPVRRIMRTQLDSINKINRYHGPLLQSHCTQDDVVPFHLGKELFAAYTSDEKRFVPVHGGQHNSPQPEYYYHAIEELISDTATVAQKFRELKSSVSSIVP